MLRSSVTYCSFASAVVNFKTRKTLQIKNTAKQGGSQSEKLDASSTSWMLWGYAFVENSRCSKRSPPSPGVSKLTFMTGRPCKLHLLNRAALSLWKAVCEPRDAWEHMWDKISDRNNETGSNMRGALKHNKKVREYAEKSKPRQVKKMRIRGTNTFFFFQSFSLQPQGGGIQF